MRMLSLTYNGHNPALCNGVIWKVGCTVGLQQIIAVGRLPRELSKETMSN